MSEQQQQQRGKNTASRPHTGKVIIEEDESPRIPAQPIILPLQNMNSQAFENRDEKKDNLRKSLSIRTKEEGVNMID